MVITVQNSIYSVLFLVLSFVSATSMLFLVECEFLSLLFIVIYVGAIAVLFLFVVMMLNVKTINTNKDTVKYFLFGVFVGLAFFFEIITIILKNFKENPYDGSVLFNKYQNWYVKLDSFTEMEALGQILYTHYVLQFLIGGLILFVSLIGAVILTINPSQLKSKSQAEFKQQSRLQQNVLRT